MNTASTPGAGRGISGATAIWMVTAAALYSPLDAFLGNRHELVQPIRHALLGLVVAAICAGVVFALVRFGIDRSLATYSTMVAIATFWMGRAFTDRLGIAAGVGTGIVLTGVVVAIVWRLRGLGALDVVFFSAAVFLTVAPWVSDALRPSAPEDLGELVRSDVRYVGNGYTPDVYLVSLDAYPGIQTLGMYDDWNPATVSELEVRGFNVEAGWTGYSMTALSLPGLLDASYPVRSIEGAVSVGDPAQPLINEGQAASLRFFHEADYRITMVESTWGGYECGPGVDSCVQAPLLDGLLYHALEQSYAGPLLDRTVGSAWIHGARRSVQWLDANAGSIARNGHRDFVFAHLVLPHPPFLLDEGCDLDYRPEFDQIAVDLMGNPPGILDAHLAQVACLDRMLVDLVDAIPSDAVVILTSDHGSALSGQFVMPPSEWTTPMIRERMSTFFAMRAPEACQPAEPVIVQNLMRGVMRCMGVTELPDLPMRMFLGNVSFDENGRSRLVEASATQVAEVLAG